MVNYINKNYADVLFARISNETFLVCSNPCEKHKKNNNGRWFLYTKDYKINVLNFSPDP